MENKKSPALKEIKILDKRYQQIIEGQSDKLKLKELVFRLKEIIMFRHAGYDNYPELVFNDLKILSNIRVIQSIVIVFGVIIFCLFLMAVVLPQTINFAFAKQQSCIISPVLFPQLLKEEQPGFNIYRPASLTIGGFKIYSNDLCASPKAKLQAQRNYKGRQSFQLAGFRFISKDINVNTSKYPKPILDLTGQQSQALSLIQPMEFKLDAKDEVFNYVLLANGKKAACKKQGLILSCGLMPLRLSYGVSYKIALIRQFRGESVETAFAEMFKTITAVGVAKTSIGGGVIVYDTPNQITIETTKTLTNVGHTTMTYLDNEKTKNFPVSVSFKNNLVSITFKQPLVRGKAYKLIIENVTATDKSQFEQAYNLAFTVSGGPKVTSTNISKSGVDLNSKIQIIFDQTLDGNQSLQGLVSLKVNDILQSPKITIWDNTITIYPSSNFPICANIDILVGNDIKNPYGITGNSAWSYKSRTVCHTTYSIGSSVKGRPIIAYQFGLGSKIILYIGAMHGNERNSMAILQRWLEALDANPEKIPSNNTIVIVPSVNPDGVAAYSRLNTNGVDLNRNFPTDDWRTEVTEPDSGGVLTNAGGPFALSEPESLAIANFVKSKNIRLAITYHSQASLVESNGAADSVALGERYGSLAGYRAIPAYNIGNTFDYSTNGAFEDWLGQKLGIPALLIELSSRTNDEYYRNQSAMLDLTQIN